MLFNSLSYALFLPIVVGLYFLIPPRHRWMLLLSASYYFYASWKVEYLPLMLLSTAIDYVCGARIGSASKPSRRKAWLSLSLISNLGILFAFKYLNFASDSLRALASQFGASVFIPHFELLLPMGISFYTFQSMAYSIDIYRGRMRPERHFGIFCLYVAYFPQLVAGPIERADVLIPQLRQKFNWNSERILSGLRLILWGLFLKVGIADKLAPYVDAVFDHPEKYHGIPVLIAAYFFSFQIYCDFCGYSEIARGSARLMGVELSRNFNAPYTAESIADFWRRWHLSLSGWFRDYVYLPLGGSRHSRVLTVRNTLTVFLLSGLWHGANWTFVVWGGLHGILMIPGILRKRPVISSPAIRRFLTFHAVVLSWIFFRSAHISVALQLLGNLIKIDGWKLSGWTLWGSQLGMLICVLCIGVVALRDVARPRLQTIPLPVRWMVYQAGILYILFVSSPNASPFLYFQF